MDLVARAGLRGRAKGKDIDWLGLRVPVLQKQDYIILGDSEIVDLAPVDGLGWDFTINFVGYQN